MTKPMLKQTKQHHPSHRPSAMHTFIAPFSPRSTSPEPEEYKVLQKAQEVKGVRFILSPPPEGEDIMSQRASQRLREKQIVTPSAPKEEEVKFGASATWDREQLNLLGVRFNRDAKRLNLEKILKVNESIWPLEVRARVAEGVTQLKAVDTSRLIDGTIEIYDVEDLAPKFTVMFESLLNVASIQDKKARAKASKLQASQASTVRTSSKRPAESQDLAGTAKRLRTESSQSPAPSPGSTPDRLTVPEDPDFSTGTNKSGRSVEFKDEESTRKLLSNMLSCTRRTLGRESQLIKWPQTEARVELFQSDVDRMTFILGTETIVSINDGGIGIRYTANNEIREWQPGGVIRPVLSFEAKRRYSGKVDDKDVEDAVAGQIFCEMLGQTCYKEFYNNPNTEYQEAFVIHASHSSVTIYYCKLPNSYLAEIAANGVRHTQRSNTRVTLRRSIKYHMRKTSERVALFEILAKLLWYLINGQSHVGHLFDHEDNPLHKLGRVISERTHADTASPLEEPMMYDSITVEPPPEEGVETGEAVVQKDGDSSYTETTDSDDGSDESMRDEDMEGGDET